MRNHSIMQSGSHISCKKNNGGNMASINGINIPDDTNAVKLEPASYLDKAVIEYDSINDVLIYDTATLIKCFVEMGMTEEEAWDWFNYNTLGTTFKGYPKFIFEK